jgi:hypothetical protein
MDVALGEFRPSFPRARALQASLPVYSALIDPALSPSMPEARPLLERWAASTSSGSRSPSSRCWRA